MSLKALLAKFASGSKTDNQYFIVIQADAVYFSDPENSSSEVNRFPIDSNWEQTLDAALATIDIKGSQLTVVISSQFYQSYQIDKPEIPEEEWSSALPFLLKDLITERVTDIVADGYPLSDGKKAQAYVLNKAVLASINGIVGNAGGVLNRIVPEDEVWGYLQNDYPNFMLLHRSQKSNFKIGAYVERKIRFQRAIRGVVSPITGTAMGDLQLDSLALEIQRSTDFLSSQFRDVSINHLFVCCDEEMQLELVTALSERLGIQVYAATDQDNVVCGEILIQLASSLPSEGINLFPSYLKPKKELLTLNNTAILWGSMTVIMLSVYGYYTVQNTNHQKQAADITREVNQLNQELKVVQGQVAAHKPTPSKISAIERIKIEVEGKKNALDAISKFDTAEKVGYSGVMTSLSELDTNDISISSIALEKQKLSLSGLARTPDSVPRFVAQFKNEVELIGRSFEQLTIGRNENDIVTFQLTTSVDSKTQISPKKVSEGQ
ncbi:MSHA biogenesis protein MshI [Vibrio hannami]|uniref:MSHA biogenesis protein MshI n=1 Tax=Vibrio hannami TaxID=2717094 RepID=UPI00240F1B62|nr:MSHA biogenesis protein MshI [Vibrio hannami]MDG3084802.1 MSHA biogenesis protein MshI [Vibrio hannami]